MIRPYEGLQMAMLNYVAEMRDPAEAVGELPSLGRIARQIHLAERLIEGLSEAPFDFSDYVDPYDERVQPPIEAKVEGRELVAPEVNEEPEVINLMDALRQSVERATGHKAGGAGSFARAGRGPQTSASARTPEEMQGDHEMSIQDVFHRFRKPALGSWARRGHSPPRCW